MNRTYALDTIKSVGDNVKLQGWVDTIRDHGQLLFIEVRDKTGKVQVVFDIKNKINFQIAKSLGNEYVVEVEGIVRNREPSLINTKLETGSIEVLASRLTVLNKSKPLPFPIDTDGREIDENIRLRYRYLDIRRKRLSDIMRKKHKFLMGVRSWMDSHDFLEIMTPLLTSSSPEGARDFLVPSRLNPGEFFVLPQAPQQYKQLLMVGGVDRYFQIAPCARDEDPRADRHAGIFYQIDVEISFPTQSELFKICENMLLDTYKIVAPDKTIRNTPFPRMSYSEALDRFGSDKPDTRFGLELQTVTDLLTNKTDFKIFNNVATIKCIVVENAGSWSRTQILKMEDFAKAHGAKGLAYAKVTENGLETGISKFLEQVSNDLLKQVSAKSGDLIFFGAGDTNDVNNVLSEVRKELGKVLKLYDPNELSFVWITGFPFYEMGNDGDLDFGHNPFSMPKGGLSAFDKDDPLDIESLQFDLTLNGYEVLSGSIRNHDPEILIKAFERVGYDEEHIIGKFGALYNAFSFGAPPHGGWAIGFDRLFMILIDESNIRDVYAFPKNSRGFELMMDAPSRIPDEDLTILGIRLTDKAKLRLKNKQSHDK